MRPRGAKRVKVQVMDTLPGFPLLRDVKWNYRLWTGVIRCDVDQDVLYIAQVERYGINGNIVKALHGRL